MLHWGWDRQGGARHQIRHHELPYHAQGSSGPLTLHNSMTVSWPYADSAPSTFRGMTWGHLNHMKEKWRFLLWREKILWNKRHRVCCNNGEKLQLSLWSTPLQGKASILQKSLHDRADRERASGRLVPFFSCRSMWMIFSHNLPIPWSLSHPRRREFNKSDYRFKIFEGNKSTTKNCKWFGH